jgi:hypothetical protein
MSPANTCGLPTLNSLTTWNMNSQLYHAGPAERSASASLSLAGGGYPQSPFRRMTHQLGDFCTYLSSQHVKKFKAMHFF